jgi:hypothetical protein
VELQKFEDYLHVKDFLTRNGFAETILEDILSLIEKENWMINNFVIDGIRMNVNRIKELVIEHLFVEAWNDAVETNIDVKMTHLSHYMSLPYFLIIMIVKELKEKNN